MCVKLIVSGLMVGLLGCAWVPVSGTSSPRNLIEPSKIPLKPTPTTLIANRTLTIPVAFKMSNESDSCACAVTRINFAGNPVGEAVFQAGSIVAREFEKIVKSNFHVVSGDETPIAIISVDVDRATAKVLEGSDEVESSISVHVKVSRADGSEKCYSKVFNGTKREVWHNKSIVPSSFYQALESAINGFTADFGADETAVARILGWWRNANPQILAPSLKAPIKWTKVPDANGDAWAGSGEVWTGTCEIERNGYELSAAMEWANVKIAAACRMKLGNIAPARVRVVYVEDPDEKALPDDSKVLRFSFRTFARKDMVLSYDPMLNKGFVFGDLEMMGVTSEQADSKLEAYVINVMGSYGRRVNDPGKRYLASVRFTGRDDKNDLLVKEFELVFAP